MKTDTETKNIQLKNLFAKIEKLLHVKGCNTYNANQELDKLLSRALAWCDSLIGTEAEYTALDNELDEYIRKTTIVQKNKLN